MSKGFDISEKKSKYFLDELSSHISNIPYDKYISKENLDADCEYALISSDYSAEKNSEIIQNDIDRISDAGGGILAIKPGKYCIRTIELKSNIVLWLSYGVELIASGYDETQQFCNDKEAVIFAENAENIRLTGGGKINGNGEEFVLPAAEKHPFSPLEKFNTYERVIKARKRIRFSKGGHRLHLVCFNACKNLEIENITLYNSANWTCCINECSEVNIRNTVIDNNIHTANTDGIDIVSSQNVNIEKAFIATADDGICIKTFTKPAYMINIKDCEVISFANCFKIGTETKSDIRKVYLSSSVFYMPRDIVGGYAGIAVESADGANISDVHIKDIEMFGVSSVFLIWLGRRLRDTQNGPGSVKNIDIEKVYAYDIELPSAVTGCTFMDKEYCVQDLSLTDIHAYYRDTGENLNIKYGVDEISMSDYPEITRVSHIYRNPHEKSDYWDLPCYGIFLRNLDNINFRRCETIPRKCNEREEIWNMDVKKHLL